MCLAPLSAFCRLLRTCAGAILCTLGALKKASCLYSLSFRQIKFSETQLPIPFLLDNFLLRILSLSGTQYYYGTYDH
jgi:hypothetical protein